MTKSLYFKNIIIGVIIFLIISIVFMKDHDSLRLKLFWVFSLVNTFFFPIAKMSVEKIALKFTTKDFWHRGILADDIGKNGIYAIYWLFCFIFAIPLSIISIFLKTKKAG